MNEDAKKYIQGQISDCFDKIKSATVSEMTPAELFVLLDTVININIYQYEVAKNAAKVKPTE